jgi:hypothetical protein
MLRSAQLGWFSNEFRPTRAEARRAIATDARHDVLSALAKRAQSNGSSRRKCGADALDFASRRSASK